MYLGLVWQVRANRRERSTCKWVSIGFLCLDVINQLTGTIMASLFTVGLDWGAAGFFLCARVSGMNMIIYAIWWYFIKRNSENKTERWTELTACLVSAFFFTTCLVGLLGVAGLWVTDSDGEL